MRIVVCGWKWERAWLILTLRRTDGSSFPEKGEACLASGDGRLGALAVWERDPGECRRAAVRLNVTNAGNSRQVEPGEYGLFLEEAGRREPVFIEQSTDPDSDREKDFSYGRNGGTYSARLEADDEGALKIIVRNAEPSALGGAKGIYRRAMRTFLQAEYDLRHGLRKKGGPKKILFLSEQNPTLAGNLQVLKERIGERGLAAPGGAYSLAESCRVTVTREHLGFGSWVGTVRKLSEADFVFLDDHAPILDWLKLKGDTQVIQLWHGGVGFKDSGYTRWGHGGSLPPVSAYRRIDWGICASEADRDVFSELWGIRREKILPAGMPRLDALLTPSEAQRKREEARRRFPQTEGKKVILYAPTYRGENRMNASFPFEAIDFPAWHEACGEEWVVLIRMHPWVREKVPVPENCRDRLIDAGGMESAMDLFGLADLLVTDYSSAIFEFSALKKPMLFYAFDREEYEAARGIHGDYRRLAPGKVTETFADLLEAIRRSDFEEERAAAYRAAHFDCLDAGSTDRVIDWVLLGGIPPVFRMERAEGEKAAARIGRTIEL